MEPAHLALVVAAIAALALEPVRALVYFALAVRGIIALARDLAHQAPTPPQALVAVSATGSGEGLVVPRQAAQLIVGLVGATLHACRDLIVDEVLAIDARIAARRTRGQPAIAAFAVPALPAPQPTSLPQ